jgi:hypothetical protein
MTITDTPRCEAERFEALEGSALRRDCVKLNFARQLERELTASKAEVERLTGILKSLRKSPSTEWHKSNKVLLK